jgi:Zn-dependent protease with chaperone function/uncharacterized tellurite resistance protein B-like protein
MDFFTRQDNARKKTKWLVLYFVMAVAFTIAFIYLACALIFLRHLAEEGSLRWLWHGQLFAGVTGVTLLIILIGNIYKVATLSKGGSSVAILLGGQPVNANTRNPDERKLINVVEEMAIASGTPVPEIFILPDEQGINAFAAGHTSQDAAVGVTRGCVQHLSRDELQGVIAHEFSHILNGDMSLNIRLIGIVHGLVCIALLGRILLYSGYHSSHRHRHYMLGARSEGKGGNPLPILGIALLIIGGIGILCGRLIKSAVSRQREFLADASAVQFTRNPSGLAGALKKIGSLSEGSRLQSARAEEASHLFFSNGLRSSWINAFATHPPLADRIKAIDSTFDGSFPPLEAPRPETAQATGKKTKKKGRSSPLGIPPILPIPPISQFQGESASGRSLDSSAPATGETVMAQIGSPTPDHLEFAVQLIAALPTALADAAHDPSGAVALIYLLLLSPDPEWRTRQEKELENKVAKEILQEIAKLQVAVGALDKKFHLPLAELTLPALRSLSPSQYQPFIRTMHWLVESDQQLDLFEYALQKMVVRHLKPHFEPVRKRVIQYHSLKALTPDIAILASALAHVGHDTGEQAQQSFSKGLQCLPVAHRNLTLVPIKDCRLDAIDQAMDRVSHASPPLKKVLIKVCLDTVAADGQLQLKETELMRAIADSMDCPIPPLLANAS